MRYKRLEPLGNGLSIFVTDEHHFTTDTILLADFSRPRCGNRCVDLGTGCGTIPIIWCRELSNLSVTAVEIQKNAYDLACENVTYNGLEKKISVLNSDLKELKGKIEYGSVDLVVCNPPYKLSGSGIINSEATRKIARHETECTLDDICQAASNLLQFGGRLCICQRPERLADAMESMRRFNIEPKTLRLVQQRLSKSPKLFLLEGRRGGKRGFMNVMPTLFIENEKGDFSDEMIRIYGSYKKDFI